MSLIDPAPDSGPVPVPPASASDVGGEKTRASDLVLPEGPAGSGSESSTGSESGRMLGKYRLLRRIGRGGMGEVYEAEDTVLERRVAVKLLPISVAGEPRRLERFVREARAAARLNHPHVVTVYDVGQEAGTAFLVLELVQGETLQGRLEAGGGIPWLEATRVIADVSRGLAAAHAAGIIHRDIKPSNILRTPDGIAKLGDFGLAKALDAEGASLTGSGFLLGTPHYMSPEQCRAEPTDERSDVYSLGATYHALLTGRPPFAGTTAMQILFAHCSNPPPDARDAVPDVPDRCVRIVQRAMAKEARDRFASVPELLAEVESVLTGTPAATALRGPAIAGGSVLPQRSEPLPESPARVPTRLSGGPSEAIHRVRGRDDLFADAAVLNRYLTQEQLDQARSERDASGEDIDLGVHLLARGLLSPDQVEKLRHAVEVVWKRRQAEAAADPADPLVGKVLAGEFRLVRLIGRGGMGSVYLGEQLSLGRKVAVKLLPMVAMSTPDLRARFDREARAAARLQHPNIVQVHFCGEDAGQPFIVMELVEGRSLGERLAQEGRLSPKEALAVSLQVARALSAAHQQGIVHRDLKPDNVFVGQNGSVKLGDFGLARDLTGLPVSLSGEVMGTPRYMSPEQCRGQRVDGRADLYSLGATLFHMVAGRPPYDGDSLLEIMNRHVSAPVPSLREMDPAVSDGLDGLVQRLLQKDPVSRPQTAEEAVGLIRSVMAGKPVAAPTPAAPISQPGPEPATATSEGAALERAARARLAEWESRPARRDDSLDEFQQRRVRSAVLGGGVAVALGLAVLYAVAPTPDATGRGPEPSPANAAVTGTDTPVPANHPALPAPEPPAFAMARKALGQEDWQAAVELLEKLPAETRYGPFEPTWKALREEIATRARERAQPLFDRARRDLAAGDHASARAALDEVDGLGSPDLVATATEERKRLEAAVAAARERFEEEQRLQAEALAQAERERQERERQERLTREQAEAAWAALAPEAWGWAMKRNWKEAVARTESAAREAALAPHAARVAALERLLLLGRAANDAVVKGLRTAVGQEVRLVRATGGMVEGMLERISESGTLTVRFKGVNAGTDLAPADLSAAERRRWAEKALTRDVQGLASAAVFALAEGESAAADAWLRLPASDRAPVAADLALAAEGWDAPWSPEAVESRRPAPRSTPGSGPPDPGDSAPPSASAGGDLRSLSDEFSDGAASSRWKRLCKEERWGYDPLEHFGVREGWLAMKPYSSSWYMENHAELTYREVEGDFIATTSLVVRNTAGDGAPASEYSLGGLMARAPRKITPAAREPGGENYVFVALGMACTPGQMDWEYKTTRDSKSEVGQIPAGTYRGEVRLVRIGSAFLMLVRPEGGRWKMFKRFDRPDLPVRLQVGLVAYTDWQACRDAGEERHNRGELSRKGVGSPDLVARFDYVRFRRPNLPAALSARKLTDYGAVGNDDLLPFLGEAADGK